jgi:hypothetical protein
MPRMGFEPMIPMFMRAKTVHALDCDRQVFSLGKVKVQLSLCLTKQRVVRTYTGLEVWLEVPGTHWRGD